MELDDSHIVISSMRALLPEAVVAGGSFSAWLPAPESVRPADRGHLLETAKQEAVRQAIRRVLRDAGVPDTRLPERGGGGDRIWPPGYVGSLSHKGTVVLVALAKSDALVAVGIDVERCDGDDLLQIRGLVAPEALPRSLDPAVARNLALSAKEAVFKAQYPITSRRLSFEDVHLAWGDAEDGRVDGNAQVADGPMVRVRCRAELPWIISAALLTTSASS